MRAFPIVLVLLCLVTTASAQTPFHQSLSNAFEKATSGDKLQINIGGSPDDHGQIIISGEGGVAFFDTGPDGIFPNSEFRVDEAKLFVEASLWDDIYFYSELNLLTRESDDEDFHLGELYVDFENVSKLWGQPEMLNVRGGRMDIPFGEEYLTRDSIDNALISHSISDIWGVDEGVEVYGKIKMLHYVFAVQNGGMPLFRDFNSDKAIIGKVSVDPKKSLHLSFSAMRTGALNPQGDKFSEAWFGNGFLLLLGNPSTTTEFHGNYVEGDARYNWNDNHISGAGGKLHYDDDDTASDNHRDVTYYYLEAQYVLKHISENKWYVAARYSHAHCDQGFPIVGLGDFSRYLFDPESLTKSLWRLSFGSGYSFGKNVLIKAEYSFERREPLSYADYHDEHFVGLEVALKF
jgi:hypothetical protein